MHFTYTALDMDTLHQGDVVDRTEGVEQLLKEVHPHYYNSSDYRFFVVLTQSCDLIRRAPSNKCTSRYITLAAVRPLQLVLARQLEKVQYDPIERELGFCDLSRMTKLTQFMERLLNNNESEYFFLYRDSKQGLDVDHCTFLKLSIAVKSEIHYETLLKAKMLQLAESFEHKLGYLVGNLYSRVGTKEWPPDEVFNALRDTPFKNPDLVLWLDGDVHKRVLRKLKTLSPGERSLEALHQAVKEEKATKITRRRSVLDIVGQTLQQVGVDIDKIPRIQKRLENHPEFRSNIK